MDRSSHSRGRYGRRCSTAWLGSLALAAGLLLAGRLVAKSPGPEPCGGSDAARRELDRQALALARRAFPAVRFSVAGDGCLLFGDTGQVRFDDFVQTDVTSRVTFQVKEPMGLLPGMSPRRFQLVPFRSPAEVELTARQVRGEPVVRHAFGAQPLRCTVDTDAPGATAYHACTTGPAPSSGIGLHVENAAPVVKLQQPTGHPSYGGARGTPVVHEYALPASKLHPEARGWAAARKEVQVKAFLGRHPGALVVLKQ